MAGRRGNPKPQVPDELLPVREYPHPVRRFEPEQKHHDAVEAFMETHSVAAVREALGVGTAAAFAFTKRSWFQERLRELGFQAVNPNEVGEAVAVGAAVKALDVLEAGENLSVDQIAKIGNLGAKLMDAGKAGGNTVMIGNVTQVDARSWTADEMREFLGGSAAVAASDVIDTEWESS